MKLIIQKNRLLFLSFAAFFLMLLSSCKDDVTKDLKKDQRELILKIISDMVKENLKDSLSYKNYSGETYAVTKYLYDIKASFDEISQSEATNQKNEYAKKRAIIESTFSGNLRRDAGGKARDTKSIWIPTDSLAPFMKDLILLQATGPKTGIRINLASYPYDGSKDALNTAGARPNGDMYSGRTTLFFTATQDTVAPYQSNYSMRHANVQKNARYVALVIRNHGTLCPDSCASGE